MALVVMKFGGTSVGSAEKIWKVAAIVARSQQEGNRVTVVVSAMSGETDRLLTLAREVSPNPAQRELDVMVSSGERVSIALLSMALRDIGCPARSFTGRHVPSRLEKLQRRHVHSAL